MPKGGHDPRGFPAPADARAALRLAAEYQRRMPRAAVTNDRRLGAIIALLEAVALAMEARRPTRGRPLDIARLIAAARAVDDAGLRLTARQGSRAVGAIAAALECPEATARDLARRLIAFGRSVGLEI
jgi:hypothetical protein